MHWTIEAHWVERDCLYALTLDQGWPLSHVGSGSVVAGILIPVKNRADHKVQKLKETNDQLTQQVSNLQELNSKMVSLLISNGPPSGAEKPTISQGSNVYYVGY